MDTRKSKVVLFPVADLIVSSKNPRSITEKAIEDLMLSIERDPSFLNSRPLLVNYVNGMYVVYAGNQRLAACMRLEMEEVPVIIEENVSAKTIEYRILADNVHQGEWDEEKLLKEFSETLKNVSFKPSDFKDVNFKTSKETKSHTAQHNFKLVFNEREGLATLYTLLEDLMVKEPQSTVSQRLTNYLESKLN